MVHPKYSPGESLRRMKLMMEYDSKKTLTENKKVVESKQRLNEAAPVPLIATIPWLTKGVAAMLGGGAALGVGAGLWSEYTSADTKDKYKLLASGCDKNDASAQQSKRETMSTQEQTKIANIFRKSFSWTLFGLNIGGGTDLDLLAEALGLLEKTGNYGDFCKVRKIYGPKFDSDLIDELNESETVDVISTLELLLSKSQKGNVKARDAETANTNWWLETFPCLEISDSFADPINVETDRYGNTWVLVNFKIRGQVKPFHLLNNGRIYTADTHKYTGKKVVCSGTKTTVVSESLKKKPISEQADLGNIDLVDRDLVDLDVTPNPTPNPNPTPGPTPLPRPGSSYRDCTRFYVKGCKSDVIKKVQGCLGGLTQDGKFGPRTEAKLEEKFPEFSGGFRDNEVDKICSKTSTPDDPFKDFKTDEIETGEPTTPSTNTSTNVES